METGGFAFHKASPVQGEVPSVCEAEGLSQKALRIRIHFH